MVNGDFFTKGGLTGGTGNLERIELSLSGGGEPCAPISLNSCASMSE